MRSAEPFRRLLVCTGCGQATGSRDSGGQPCDDDPLSGSPTLAFFCTTCAAAEYGAATVTRRL